MKVTKEQYSSMVKAASPPSPHIRNFVFAFLIGGTICAFGQLLFVLFKWLGLDEDTASTIVSVTLIFITAVLTGLGVFDKIAKFGGAGTLVPITGFANAMSSPAIEFKSEGWILGLGAKIFTIAGPVIVYGTVASVVYGIIYWVTTLF